MSSIAKICVLGFLVAISGNCAIAQCNYLPQELPAGLDSYFVISADTTFTPASSPYSVPDGSIFDTHLGRSPAQIATRKSDAIAHFLTMFGIDFTAGDIDPSGNVELFHESTDLNWNERVYYAGDNRIDTSGWVVRQGYYVARVTGSFAIFNGTWGGAAGETVPTATYVQHGDIEVETRVPCRDPITGVAQPDQTGTLFVTYGSLRPSRPRTTSIAAQDFTLNGIGSGGVGYGAFQIFEDGAGDIRVLSHMQLKFNP